MFAHNKSSKKRYSNVYIAFNFSRVVICKTQIVAMNPNYFYNVNYCAFHTNHIILNSSAVFFIELFILTFPCLKSYINLANLNFGASRSIELNQCQWVFFVDGNFWPYYRQPKRHQIKQIYLSIFLLDRSCGDCYGDADAVKVYCISSIYWKWKTCLHIFCISIIDLSFKMNTKQPVLFRNGKCKL